MEPNGSHRRLDDDAARQRALAVLSMKVGRDCSAVVAWDPDHHLQGHLDVGGEHLVVIAARDDAHQPMVLSEADWDALRHPSPAVA